MLMDSYWIPWFPPAFPIRFYPPHFPPGFFEIFIGDARDETPRAAGSPNPCVAGSVLSTFHHFPSNSIRFPSFFVVAPIPGLPPSSLSLWFREDSGDTRNKCSQWQQDPESVCENQCTSGIPDSPHFSWLFLSSHLLSQDS